MDKNRYLRDGEVIKTALNKRDFAKSVVIHQFNQEDIRDMINTINISNDINVVNDKVSRVNNGYKATFGLEYNFPTKSSALLFKTINNQLTNSGRTSETLELEHNARQVTVNIKHTQGSEYISTLQGNGIKLTKESALNKEKLILGSEIFTDTVSNLMSSGLYDFFKKDNKNQLVESRIYNEETFNHYEKKCGQLKHSGFLKSCIQGHLINHDENLNNDIVNIIRSVEHKMLKEKEKYSEKEIKASGKNFEIGQKINNLQALQIDICQICSPEQKVDNLNMQKIRKLIKSSSNDDFEPIDQASNNLEVKNAVNIVSDFIKNNILEPIQIAMKSNGEIIDKKVAPKISLHIDPSKHNIRNKYT